MTVKRRPSLLSTSNSRFKRQISVLLHRASGIWARQMWNFECTREFIVANSYELFTLGGRTHHSTHGTGDPPERRDRMQVESDARSGEIEAHDLPVRR